MARLERPSRPLSIRGLLIMGVVTASATAMVVLIAGRDVPTDGPQEPAVGHEYWDGASGYETEHAVADWNDGRQVTLQTLPFPAWALPEDPSWTEDPYGNQSWTFWYHSLTWLKTPAYGFLTTGDGAYAADVAHYLFDWIRDNPRQMPASGRAWYDHAVAIRTDAMVYLYDKVLAGRLSRSQRAELEASLLVHGQVLRSYMDSERFVGHNHNYFHSLSLYQLAVHFPELDGAEDWRSRARQRVSELMREMVDSDGVSTEQSATYQLIAISLFTRADTYLRQFDDGLAGHERELLAKMVDAAALLIRDDGSTPALGDTAYNNSLGSRLARLAVDDVLTPWARYVLADQSERDQGERTPDIVALPSSGYVIVRPAQQPGTHLFANFGRERRVHGHWDQLSFTYFAKGVDVLVDSGGPFEYGTVGRGQFMAPHSHNTVVIDGELRQAGDARLLGAYASGDIYVARGSRQSESGVDHVRTLVLLSGLGLLLVIDQLEPAPGGQHTYEAFYQLPPGTSVQMFEDMATFEVSDQVSGTLKVRASAQVTLMTMEGVENDRWLGWITDGTRSRIPAPAVVIAFDGGRSWLVTAVQLSDSALELGEVVQENDRLVLPLALDGTYVELRISEDTAELSEVAGAT